jgi:hypothetical protein
MGFGGGGFGGLPLGGMGSTGGSSSSTSMTGNQAQDQAVTEQSMQGGPMSFLNTTIPGVLLFLGIILVATGLFMFSMVKVWSPRIWLPMVFGIGIALGGQLFRLRSKKIMMSFGAAEVCEICGVELALRQCFRCGRWLGPGCQGKFYDAHGELVEDDTRCIECTTCHICGRPTKGYQCLKCGDRVCTECLDETERYCIKCSGELKMIKDRKTTNDGLETQDAQDARVAVVRSPLNLPSALVRKISGKVKKDLVGKELFLGSSYTSLGTRFTLVGSSPSGKIRMKKDTRLKVIG